MTSSVPKNQAVNKYLDVQSDLDYRNIAIKKVGIKGYTIPIVITDKTVQQKSIATCSLAVNLPFDQRNANLSSFIQILNEDKEDLSFQTFKKLPDKLKLLQNSVASYIELAFTFFKNKHAPVSRIQSLMDYNVSFIHESLDEKTLDMIKVIVHVTSLCPCSKKISDYGAHNQRSEVTVTVCPKEDEIIWVEDLIDIVENNASSELYSILTVEDEKYVTEKAYNNPKFVEDMIRDLATELGADKRLNGYKVEVENFESIHNHSAYAAIDKLKLNLNNSPSLR